MLRSEQTSKRGVSRRHSRDRSDEIILMSDDSADNKVASRSRSQSPAMPRLMANGASNGHANMNNSDGGDNGSVSKASETISPSSTPSLWKQCAGYMNSIRLIVLIILCLQNTCFTLLRRYSLGVLKEKYSKYEVLLVAEVIKIVYCMFSIGRDLKACGNTTGLGDRLRFLFANSRKMFILALIYGAMNILSFVALKHIGAGLFTIFAQCKILTTASFSSLLLGREYSWTQWRALYGLIFGVLLFSEPIWGDIFLNQGGSTYDGLLVPNKDGAMPFVGAMAVLIEVTLSGFASIYFEKIIKTDALKVTIWERNFQLAVGSLFVYIAFMIYDGGGEVGYFAGWSLVAFSLSILGAAGGLLVALSIKYGDSILKTLATTSAIVLSAFLDHYLLGGPLTHTMMIATVQVIIAICNYTFDSTPATPRPPKSIEQQQQQEATATSPSKSMSKNSIANSVKTTNIPITSNGSSSTAVSDEELGMPLLRRK